MIVHYEKGRSLADREALAMVTGRSRHTIRLRCQVVRYKEGRALYDVEDAVARLALIPARQRDREKRAS